MRAPKVRRQGRRGGRRRAGRAIRGWVAARTVDVLGGRRERPLQRGGRRRGRRPARGWQPVVQGGWRHADPSPGPARGPVPLARRGEEIAVLRAGGHGVREIRTQAGPLAVDDLQGDGRNAPARGGYRATVAQLHAERRARRPKTAKLVADEKLRDYVQERLAGQVRRPDGAAVPGPGVKAWKGRNRPCREDRRWAGAWSPEQISNRLRLDFPDDESMRIAAEAIYQSLYVGRCAAS